MSVVDRVVASVSLEYRVGQSEILGKSRLKGIVDARREALRRLYAVHGRRTPELAKAFGMKHTSVRHHLLVAGVRMGRR